MHLFAYDPAPPSETTKSAACPDNQVNKMACDVLDGRELWERFLFHRRSLVGTGVGECFRKCQAIMPRRGQRVSPLSLA
jgi:hypothetical protein